MSTSKAIEIQQESYTLHETPAIPFPFEVYLNAFSIVHFLSWTLWLLHILTHLAFAYQIKQDASHVPWRIWIAVLSDLLLAIPELLTACNIGLALCTGKAAHPRPSYRLHGRVAPSVDIMITACGEPADMVINTVAAAAAQDYPPKQFRIFVLDDSRDADLRHAVDLLKLGLDRVAGPQVIYLSRTVMPGQPSYFKSGNLRFGIEQSQRLGEGSMLLAGLDADMIPEPSWLRQMVPHLLLREEVAIACGPQRYYNVPSSDPLGQQADFDIYFTVQELLNDYLGAPMCTGTGYVARRSAIAEIGGWPLAYTGEDYMCSALLTGAGWDVVFVRSFLQTGLAPESLTAAMKQRMRWTDAGLEVHQRLGPYLSTSTLTSRMKPSVRAVNMIYIIRDYSPLTTILGMLLLPLVLIPTPGADDDLIAIANKHGLFIFWAQTLFLATHMARTLRVYLTYRHLNLSLVANIHSQEMWSAPYSAYRCILALLELLPLSRKSQTPHFTVCGTISDETNERSSLHRAPLRSRLARIDILLCALYSLYAFVPLFCRLVPSRDGAYHRFPFPSFLIRELTLVIAVAKPVVYMIWPPMAPCWDELVEEDRDGVKRPRKRRELNEGAAGWWVVELVCEGLIILVCFAPW